MRTLLPRFRPSPNRPLPDWQRKVDQMLGELRETQGELREVQGAVEEREVERRVPAPGQPAALAASRPAAARPVTPPAPAAGLDRLELMALVNTLRGEAKSREQQHRRTTDALQQQLSALHQSIQALEGRLHHRI